MKSAIVLFALVAVAVASRYEMEKYDKADLKGIIEGPKLKEFLDCLTDNSLCNDYTGMFKDDFPDIVMTACAHCNAKLKSMLKQFLGAAQIRYPAEASALLGKLDPKQEYVPALQAAIADA